MIQIYDPQSGGSIVIPYSDSIPAVSGYFMLYSTSNTRYRYDGVLASGTLTIEISELTSLPAGRYLVLGHLVNTTDELYFTAPEDLEIVYVPPE